MNFGGAVAANIAANVTTTQMSLPTAKDAGNMVYQAATIGVGAYALSWAMRKVTKWKPADLAKLVVDDFLKLTGVIAVSMYVRSQLTASGIIPNEIIKAPAPSGPTSTARSTGS
jgi:hypothetical protein